MYNHPALSILYGTLNNIITQQELQELLQVDAKQEGWFWKRQFKTVEQRFLAYVYNKLNLPLTSDPEDLEFDDVYKVIDVAEQLLDEGLTYVKLREWWKDDGGVRFAAEMETRRARERLSRTHLVALAFFKDSRPFFITYDNKNELSLTEVREEAELFPVFKAEELERKNLEEAAKSNDYSGIIDELGATHIKLIPVFA